MANADLLKELRIEKHLREEHGQGPGRWPWIVGGVVLVLVLIALVAWFVVGRRAIEVQTAQAQSPVANAALTLSNAMARKLADLNMDVEFQFVGD